MAVQFDGRVLRPKMAGVLGDAGENRSNPALKSIVFGLEDFSGVKYRNPKIIQRFQ
jgi:hypothetical protein